jgi:hypothetical protein
MILENEMASTQQNSGKQVKDSAKRYTKKEIKAYIADLEEKVVNTSGAHLHSLVAINEILRSPGIDGLLDEGMKGQLRDLWIKLSSAGVQLLEPPVLFGLPEGFEEEEFRGVESEDVPELLGEGLDDEEFFLDKLEGEASEAEESEEEDSEEEAIDKETLN